MKDRTGIQDAEAQTLTTWRNPTAKTMTVDVFEGHGRPWKRFTFPRGRRCKCRRSMTRRFTTCATV